MSDLTNRQEEYLMVIAERSGGWTLTDLSEELDVSKPTALNVVNTLEGLGYAQRGIGKAIAATDAGQKRIRAALESAHALTELFVERGGFSYDKARHEARTMVTSCAPEAVKVILDGWYELNELPAPSPEEKLEELADGVYGVDVRLYKKDSRELSHGDAGLQKPALLIKENGTYRFYLRPKDLKRKILGFPLLTGRLEKLWYLQDGGWQECEYGQEGMFRIPCEALRLTLRGRKQLGRVRVRVKVNAGIFSMPDSEADLEFDVSSIANL